MQTTTITKPIDLPAPRLRQGCAHDVRRACSALLLASMMTTIAPFGPVAFAQPAPDTKAGAATAPEDEALYACKKRTGQVAVTFKPETELKDLITWVMGFTC